jgi:hypothetical protein
MLTTNIIFSKRSLRLLGHKIMGDYGYKVSRPGYSADTAVAKNLVYSSAFPTMKIAKIIHFAASGSEAHGLGFVPAYAYMLYDTNRSGYVSGQAGEAGVRFYYPNVSVDDTNVYCEVDETVYVILFAESLE